MARRRWLDTPAESPVELTDVDDIAPGQPRRGPGRDAELERGLGRLARMVR